MKEADEATRDPKYKNNPTIFAEAANLNLQGGSARKAKGYLDQGLKLNPRHIGLHQLYFELCANQGDRACMDEHRRAVRGEVK